MTALQSTVLPASIDFRDYVPASDAAPALGVNRDHLTRLCRTKLQAAGLAVHCPGPDGGAVQWWIRRTYDRRLMGELPKAIDLDAATLDRYTGKQRRFALMRAQCVDAFRDALVNRPGLLQAWLPAFLDELRAKFPELRVSRSQLYEWRKVFNGPADLEKLIDDRGGDVRSKGDAAAWAYFESIYLDQRKPKLSSCWERTKARAQVEGWAWCSSQSCRRQLEERIPPAKLCLHRNPKKYRTAFAPYIKQAIDRFDAGRCWVGDHSQLDFWCFVKERLVRLFITTWMDWRTRKIVGWVLSPEPNSSTILAALRMGMMDPANMGGPAEVIVDNGKDFDAYTWDGQTKHERLRTKFLPAGYMDEAQFSGIFGLLKIEPHYSIAYCPNGKSPQERWYGILHDQFCRTFPTYCGSKPEDKPEGLEDILKARRNVPTFQHVQQRLADFIRGYNASADHRAEGLIDQNERISPDEAMRRWCTSVRVFPPGVLDVALQMWHKPVMVGRNGVTITVVGQSLSYGAHDLELMRWKGKKKRVFVAYDPHALSSVKVYDDRLRFIAEVRANGIGGIPGEFGRQHVREQIKRQRDYDRAMRFVAANPELQYLSKYEQIGQEVARETAPPPPPADQMKLVVPELEAAAQGEALRKAAGAEGQTRRSQSDLIRDLARGVEPIDNDEFSKAISSFSLLDRLDTPDPAEPDPLDVLLQNEGGKP